MKNGSQVGIKQGTPEAARTFKTQWGFLTLPDQPTILSGQGTVSEVLDDTVMVNFRGWKAGALPMGIEHLQELKPGEWEGK